jgi:hypothetical protein
VIVFLLGLDGNYDFTNNDILDRFLVTGIDNLSMVLKVISVLHKKKPLRRNAVLRLKRSQAI